MSYFLIKEELYKIIKKNCTKIRRVGFPKIRISFKENPRPKPPPEAGSAALFRE
ncbi:hypothetical protein [Azospirillum argentinense]